MSYAIVWMPYVALLVLFALLCAPYLVAIWVVILLLAAAAVLVAAVTAPYLLTRAVGRRVRARRKSKTSPAYSGKRLERTAASPSTQPC
jgi:O-antigen ligase